MTKEVTYLDLPKNIDPVDFLLGNIKLTVPESYFTTEKTVKFYERALQSIDIKSLHSKSTSVYCGLESLPSILRHEPNHHGTEWYRRVATTETIRQSLPNKTPYKLQYLVLFDLDFPKLKDIPLVPPKDDRFKHSIEVMGEFDSVALLYGKNEQLYFVTAHWKPAEEYHRGDKEPLSYGEDYYIFHLSNLKMEITSWKDERILKRIEDGHWANVISFKARLCLALQSSAEFLEGRARSLRSKEKLFDIGGEGMSIYSGR